MKRPSKRTLAGKGVFGIFDGCFENRDFGREMYLTRLRHNPGMAVDSRLRQKPLSQISKGGGQSTVR